ncbi:27kDa outer membrane protein [hydrothermal vent metagenome]|uniref:27kDa outer membrane protein n=1 Tax=hydrothermal vent metagenome TaxID=652676 RepID=A0A3B0SXA5_9ZZZZ
MFRFPARIIMSLLGITFLAINTPGAAFNAAASDKQSDSTLSVEQKAEINQMIRDYILEQPEILTEAFQILQNRRNKAMLTKHHTRLYDDGFSFVGGNKSGDVTVIEFFDYNCGVCKRALSVVEKLKKQDSNLRVIYKEFPILSESSYIASKAAMASINQGKYPEFHAALMKNPGKLTEKRIFEIARSVGIDEQLLAKDMTSPKLERNIQVNHSLAQALNITGTPGYIVGDIVFTGGLPYGELVRIIERTRRFAGKGTN